ncbi:hypothetical protein [Mycobacterium botniense]|uniref:Uncharacterized protein n=1 Tax=Mycobacterium botniense TaxID=84962 RepID=A0A7I9XUL2_9MYCO|nr:hypothetical protein [Mycobacterium botniense]GFG73625.1 hypothetical protein MBOT_09900 [Mycobacterium botniense]
MRQYFPKGTTLNTYTAEHLRTVELEINTRPDRRSEMEAPHNFSPLCWDWLVWKAQPDLDVRCHRFDYHRVTINPTGKTS